MAKLSSKQIQLLNSLAVMQISCGRPSAALPLLHLSYHVAPDIPRTCYLLANVYHRLGNSTQSELFFNRFEENNKTRLSTKELLLKSVIAMKAGLFKEAKQTFRIALKNISGHAL